jgi:thioredoxin-dependent peroxiredoxin
MQPKVGELAPDFSTISDNGQHITLSELRGSWVVLYFYVRAGTNGCSTEAGRFEQALPEFTNKNVKVLGISTDTEASQAKMREKCSLSFPMIPDGDKKICKAYGTIGGLMGLLGVASFQTFLIDPQGKIAMHWPKVNPFDPTKAIFEALERLETPQQPA